MGKRDARGKNYLLTLEPVTVLNSDEINYKNQRNKTTLMFLQISSFLVHLEKNPRSKCHCNTTLCCQASSSSACSRAAHFNSKWNYFCLQQVGSCAMMLLSITDLYWCIPAGVLGLAPTKDLGAWGKTWTEMRLLNPKLESKIPTDCCCPSLEAYKLTSYLLV